MYFEIFLPIALGGLGSIAYKRWKDNKDNNIYSEEEVELWDYDSESCPLIMFDKNGNYYYIYE